MSSTSSGISLEAVRSLYARPLFSLLDEARAVHRAGHADQEVQLCTLLSVKTGGCPEDCGYCPQSSHHDTGVGAERMLDDGLVHILATDAHNTVRRPPNLSQGREIAAKRITSPHFGIYSSET